MIEFGAYLFVGKLLTLFDPEGRANFLKPHTIVIVGIALAAIGSGFH